jgi:hypothetical protein
MRGATLMASSVLPMHRYCVYGIAVDSDVPLALAPRERDARVRVAIRSATPAFFRRTRRGVRFESPQDTWYRYGRLADRSSYLRWTGLGEFVVSRDGQSVRCRRFASAADEAFQVYLVQRALSFALVKQGVEPLHASAIVHDGQAIALVGDSGSGKSTIAAARLREGDTLVTDDLLVLTRDRDRLMALPGPHRRG